MKFTWNKAFWLDTVERAVKTGAQVLVALIGTGSVGLLDVDWQNSLSVTIVAMIVSILTSIASSGTVDTVSPASTIPRAAVGKHVAGDNQ